MKYMTKLFFPNSDIQIILTVVAEVGKVNPRLKKKIAKWTLYEPHPRTAELLNSLAIKSKKQQKLFKDIF